MSKIKKLFKKIKPIPVLLIILILVVFLGLFKKEIKQSINFITPGIEYKLIKYEYVPCIRTARNPEYEIKSLIAIDKCKRDSGKNSLDCYPGGIDDEKLPPATIKVESTCEVKKYGKWIDIFGINLIKIGEEKIQESTDDLWNLDI